MRFSAPQRDDDAVTAFDNFFGPVTERLQPAFRHAPADPFGAVAAPEGNGPHPGKQGRGVDQGTEKLGVFALRADDANFHARASRQLQFKDRGCLRKSRQFLF